VAKTNVSGMFYVSMEVLDSLGRPVTSISKRTPGARHVVRVENISRLARDARVLARLPNGMTRIEFIDASGTACDSWDKAVTNIPKGATRDLECDVRRNSGSTHTAEPIQCDDVMEGRGALGWKPASSGVPIQITIAVA